MAELMLSLGEKGGPPAIKAILDEHTLADADRLHTFMTWMVQRVKDKEHAPRILHVKEG